ncbi:MAG: type I polyketide synthase [Cyanophyceae cyanobacterium]
MSELSPTKRALLALKQLQTKLEALEQAKHEPIAIIGMGCRFPGGADSPEEFWQLLQQGVNAVTEVPPDRWDGEAYYDPNPDTPGKMCTRHGGFVPHHQEFDAQFFRIAPREALSLDPQQRLLLEVSWEALEYSGIAPEKLEGSLTGVFVGICGIDYWQRLLRRTATEIDAYLTTGNTHSTASGRLSYLFGFTGPSLSVDTACSSSLVAVHLACQSLRHQECHLALAGGVNRLLTPEVSINFSKARMLSRHGRCRSFDAEADGFVRAEGGGVVVLKRLSDAVAEGDNILALICGSATNQDGRTSGLTSPNGPSQQAVIQQALKAGRMAPAQVSYIEAHGTGTPLGDPIELGALGSVFQERESPLIVGSVKTNIGHLEAAAGIAGLIKVVLALKHQEIPPNLHFHKPNPRVDWHELALTIPTELVSWQQAQRVAGVSAFGFSGTNAHVVVAEAPLREKAEESCERPAHLLALSARSEQALSELRQRYCRFLERHPNVAVADMCFSANTGRSHFNHRLAASAATAAELQTRLASDRPGQTADLFQGRVNRTLPQIAFIFPEECPVCTPNLLSHQPLRAPLDRCAALLSRDFDQPLLERLSAPAHRLPDAAALALQYSLAQLWISWGVSPAVVTGAGVGEIVAACVAGVISLEDGLRLAVDRERQQLTSVSALGGSLHETKLPSQFATSRTKAELKGATSESGLQLPVLAAIDRQLLRQCCLLQPLLIAVAQSEADGGAAEIAEINDTRFRLLESKFTSPSQKPEIFTVSEYPQLGWEQILESLAQLYVQGATIDWVAFDRDYARQKVVLPTYPFQRQRYWID